jgi:hypothetical protein
MTQETVKDPAIGISYGIQIDEKRNIVMQAFVARDCDAVEFNRVLDKVAAAMDRQAARYGLKALRKSLAMQQKQLRRVTEDLFNIDERNQTLFKASGKRGEYKRSTEQEAHRTNVLTTQKRFQEEIDELKAEIFEAEKVLENASDLRADS